MTEFNRFEFDIAISFAGEDRNIAEDIAKSLIQNGIKVFYDGFFDLWGKELTKQFESIFLEKAQFCLVLVSENYIAKKWTNYERQIALARQMSQTEGYILPVMLKDNLHLPGLSTVIGYVKFISVEQITNLIVTKIKDDSSKEKQEMEKNLIGSAIAVIEAYAIIYDGDFGCESYPDWITSCFNSFVVEVREYIKKFGQDPPLSGFEEADSNIRHLIKRAKESI